MADFNKAILKTLKFEGGYVNDPDDTGGETKFGISKHSYPDVDIANLTAEQAKDIYNRDYWSIMRCNDVTNQEVAENIFDTSVNMGVRTTAKIVQAVVGAKIDGTIGAKTLFILNNLDAELFVSKFKLAKIARYAYICKKRPDNRKFLFGWVRRTLES